jgi:predicted DNA-binding antitoxin AbrB/MazE fold protein
MDHTLQLGPWKCLIIVGVRLSAWEPQCGPLAHEDLVLLNLTPMEHSSGEAVAKQLRAAVPQTSRPRAILTDGGADLLGPKLASTFAERDFHVGLTPHGGGATMGMVAPIRGRRFWREGEGPMTRVEAVYERGIFRPLGPIDLPDNQRAAISVEPLPQESFVAWLQETERLRNSIAAAHGVFPDSTIDIAEGRRR